MDALFLFLGLLFLLLIGVPIAISLGLSSLLFTLLATDDSPIIIAQKLFDTMEHTTLLAIPFFILSAHFLTTGGVSQRLVDFAKAAVGWMPGGLAMATVVACMFFAAISGSSPATVVAIGSIMIPGMIVAGYDKRFAVGVVATSGSMGILIPPSIPMIVYADAVEESVGKMFIAGILPGVLMGVFLMTATWVAARKMNIPSEPRLGWWHLFQCFMRAFWGLLLILIVVGGIYGGVFTPTEAAAVAAVYSAFIALFVHRDMGLKKVPEVMLDSAKMTSMLLFIIACAMIFAHVLTEERIPQELAQSVLSSDPQPWMFLLMVNVILWFAGDFMEPSAILLILPPPVSSHRDIPGYRSHPPGYRHDHQHGSGHDHAAGGAEPVRGGRTFRHESGGSHPSGSSVDGSTDSGAAGDHLRALAEPVPGFPTVLIHSTA